MKSLAILFVFFFATTSALAQNINVQRRDMKLATQQMIEKQSIVNPGAAGTNQILNANAGATSAAAAAVTTFAAQPDVPRNLVITPGGTTADVASCVITVTGTNIFDKVITETFTFADNANTAQTGAKAFKSVTRVDFPANCEDGGFAATWSIGRGELLGLKRCMDAAGHWVWSTLNGAFEATRATVAADADEVEKNTADFNGTMNGTNDFEAFFVQNFRCFP